MKNLKTVNENECKDIAEIAVVSTKLNKHGREILKAFAMGLIAGKDGEKHE